MYLRDSAGRAVARGALRARDQGGGGSMDLGIICLCVLETWTR